MNDKRREMHTQFYSKTRIKEQIERFGNEFQVLQKENNLRTAVQLSAS